MIDVLWIAFPQFETRELYKVSKILGYRPYNNAGTYVNKTHSKLWTQHLLSTKEMNWDQLFEGYDAALEPPSILFYRDFYKKNPHLKVIIFDINYEVAYQRYKRLRQFMSNISWIKVFQHPREYLSLGEKSLHFLFQGDDSYDNAIRKYSELVEDVRNVVPPSQILILRPSDGWQPICNFLQKDVPDIPFPISHDQKNDNNIVKEIIFTSLKRRDAILLFLYIIVLVGLFSYLLFFY